jgi:pyridoxine kinase
LTDIELKDITSLRHALTILHEQYHVPNVVISSIPLKQWLIDELPEAMRPLELISEDDDYLLCLCSSIVNVGENKGLSAVHAQFVPLIPGYFVGVGDLFSALLLGHFQSEELLPPPEGEDPKQTPLSYATSMALTKTHGLLKATYQYTLTLPEDERQPTDDEKDAAEPVRKLKRMRGRELRLVQPEGQDIIRGVGSIDTRRTSPWLNFWTT